MANMNWNGGKCKSPAQAKAWLRHNDRERRACPQTKHANLDIDVSLTPSNFECGPTAGLTYGEKCARLDSLLDKWGYADGEICMQGIVAYPPDEYAGPDAVADGRFRAWCDACAATLSDMFGADNVIGMFADVDEVHDYESAVPGEEGVVRSAKPHMHVYVVPVCDVAPRSRLPVFLTPGGEETLDESAAARAFRTPFGGETDDASLAAAGDDGEPVTCPRRARTKAGKAKWRKAKGSGEPERRLSGSDFFSRWRVKAANDAVDEMTRERFAVRWNTREARDPERAQLSVEELKARSAELLDERLRREAEAAAEQTVSAVTRAKASARDVLEAARADAEAVRDQAASDAEALRERARAEADAVLDRAASDADSVRSGAAEQALALLDEARAVRDAEAASDPVERFMRFARGQLERGEFYALRRLYDEWVADEGRGRSERDARTERLRSEVARMRGGAGGPEATWGD